MIIEETELDRIRYEDLAPSLQEMIDNKLEVTVPDEIYEELLKLTNE